jgi:hypothetical protein
MQEAEAKQQARRNRQLARQQRKKQAVGAAEKQIRKFSSSKLAHSSSDAGIKHGDVKLPDAVLQTIISCLGVFEPDGVRGPCMVARDLANAALVSVTAADSSVSGDLCCNLTAAGGVRHQVEPAQCSDMLRCVLLCAAAADVVVLLSSRSRTADAVAQRIRCIRMHSHQQMGVASMPCLRAAAAAASALLGLQQRLHKP